MNIKGLIFQVSALTVLIACLYFACIKHVHVYQNIAVFLVWFEFLGAFFTMCAVAKDKKLAKKLRDRGRSGLPSWLIDPIDGAIIGFLLFHGWIFTAVLWALAWLFEMWIYMPGRKRTRS